MAFSLAAGLAMAPAPAQAKDVLFYGRPGPIAAKKAEFEVRIIHLTTTAPNYDLTRR